LSPDYVFRVGITVKVLLELCPGERVQLLNACDGRCAIVDFRTMSRERNVQLTGTEYNPCDVFMGLDLSRFVAGITNDPLEVRTFGELAQRRTSLRISQEAFAKEENQCYCDVSWCITNSIGKTYAS